MADNNDNRQSTLQAFAPGEVFVGAMLVNDLDDDYAGLAQPPGP